MLDGLQYLKMINKITINTPEMTVVIGMQALRKGCFEDWAKSIHPD